MCVSVCARWIRAVHALEHSMIIFIKDPRVRGSRRHVTQDEVNSPPGATPDADRSTDGHRARHARESSQHITTRIAIPAWGTPMHAGGARVRAHPAQQLAHTHPDLSSLSLWAGRPIHPLIESSADSTSPLRHAHVAASHDPRPRAPRKASIKEPPAPHGANAGSRTHRYDSHPHIRPRDRRRDRPGERAMGACSRR